MASQSFRRAVTKARRALRLVEGGEPEAAAIVLEKLAANRDGRHFGRHWLQLQACCLKRGDFRAISEPFRMLRFIGPQGLFILIGPYTTRRGGGASMQLSGMVGRVLPHAALPELTGHLEALFGMVAGPLPRVLPVRRYASIGTLAGEAGEAFVVPNEWGWPDSADGPALNDMREQRRRFQAAGRECIRRIFTEPGASLLLNAIEGEDAGIEVQQREYAMHDIGHASGIGLRRKLADGLLSTFWMRSVEEWRADGVAFELAARTGSQEAAGKLVAANLCVRLGIDAQRGGGIERDTDVNVSLLTFDRLLKAGAIRIVGRRLAFEESTWAGLARAVEVMRTDAVHLTREELRCEHLLGLHRLYGGLEVQPATLELFRGLVVDVCSGVYRELA